MLRCHLCQTKEADKTGSHIIPFFLIKRAVNEEGKKARDYEVSFEISTSNLVSQFFGRNLSPDRIQTYLGREITEKEIEENTNHFTRDNILCSECEKRLQIIESAFSETIYSKKDRLFKPNNKTGSIMYCDNHGGNSLVIRAFFLSIIWRISIVKLYKVALDRSIESKLRNLLNSCLPYNASDLHAQLESNASDLKKLPMGLVYIPTPSDLLMQHPNAKSPYYYFLDEFIVLFYNKHKTTYNPLSPGFGLERFTLKQILNNGEDVFKVGIMEETDATEIRTTIMKKVVHGIAATIKSNFQALFTHLVGYPAPTWYINEMFHELTLDKSTNAYTPAKIISLYTKYIYPHYSRRHPNA